MPNTKTITYIFTKGLSRSVSKRENKSRFSKYQNTKYKSK